MNITRTGCARPYGRGRTNGGQPQRRRVSATAVIAATVLLLAACDRTVGEVQNPSLPIRRDGAASALIGGKLVWAFGDTIAPGGVVRSSAALADPSDPTTVSEPLINGDRP